MARGERLDCLVVCRGLFGSRTEARTAIMDGVVLVDGVKITKPGLSVRRDAKIELIESYKPKEYVSRGGFKLEQAVRQFEIAVEGRICLDVGASSGGFTDCLLKHGAARVYAIDVGYGQLDWSLRQNSKVVVIERVNARHVTADELYGERGERADLAVMDVSFISLVKVVPNIVSCLTPLCEVVCLIKPQFEAGKDQVGKGGVVKSADTHTIVLRNVISSLRNCGLRLIGLTHSPIKGPKGNIEFLGYFSTSSMNEIGEEAAVFEAVRQAHSELAEK